MDRNATSLSGTIATKPILSRISKSTIQTEFTLVIKEWFSNKDGIDDNVESKIKIEMLGKNAEHIANTFNIGDRVCVEGFLRQGSTGVNVRAFSIFKDNYYAVTEKIVIKAILEKVRTMNTLEEVMNLLQEKANASVLKR